MAIFDGGGLGDGRLSPMCAPDFYGVKPGYGCLTCPLPSCHGCVKVMPTREEAVMLHCGGARVAGGMKKALRAAATTLSAQEKPITMIVSRTKGEKQDEAAQIDL